MKHNFLSLILAGTIISAGALTSNTVYAQENLPPEMPKMEHQFNREDFQKKMANKIADDLNLTAEQKAKAKEIRETGKKEITPLMDEMNALRKKIDAKRRANMEEFEKILTPEQKTKFEEIKKKAPRQNVKDGSHAAHRYDLKHPHFEKNIK